jgi:DNA-binding CsgD family transcriptional regulator
MVIFAVPAANMVVNYNRKFVNYNHRIEGGSPMVSKRTSAPAELRATVLQVGRSRFTLLSFPRAWHDRDDLTPAERHVTLAVIAGHSNADIARMRGSSPRTVANQLAAIFRKLGVRSRSELAARQTAPAAR